ncbi:MAG: hypothetical protein CL843_07730 [Crocinitomicaceae bacterium]|nr:hypothetical protein [Crocinitomicaceae bacterium]|tara:strand:+ start:2526 stop:3008 length:483 start_codon:yes stop_codon:yes gene_type:complete
MKINNLKVLPAFLVLFAIGELKGQEASATSGSTITGTGGSMSYTVGLVSYQSNTSTSGSNSQGVQQAYVKVVGVEEHSVNAEQIITYPNPTSSSLTLSLSKDDFSALSYELFNMQGQLIDSKVIQQDQTLLNLNNLSSAMYILKVKSNDKSIKEFTIVKN